MLTAIIRQLEMAVVCFDFRRTQYSWRNGQISAKWMYSNNLWIAICVLVTPFLPIRNANKLARPPTSCSLRITDRSFRYASPCLWNQLPSSFRQPCFSPSICVLPVYTPTTSSHSANSPLSPSITPCLFHSRLKTYLFHKSFPPQTPSQPQDWLHGLHDQTVSSEHLRFFCF